MQNKSGTKEVNALFIAIGIVTIFSCGFMGLFSAFTIVGIPAGILLIWAAFPEKEFHGDNDLESE